MINFRQKEFNISAFRDISVLVTGEERKMFTKAPLNIMKAIEMLELDHGAYVKHWIHEMTVDESLFRLLNEANLPPQIGFIGIEPNINVKCKVIGTNLYYSDVEPYYPDPISYVNFIKNRLLTEVKRGQDKASSSPKYKRWFDDHSIERGDIDYVMIFKYIALCLSGQLDPAVDDFYDNNTVRILRTTSIDFYRKNPRIGKSAKNLTNIILDCIKNIYVVNEYTDCKFDLIYR